MFNRIEVSFDFTLDEAVDVALRGLALYPGFRRALVQNALFAGLMTVIPVMVIVQGEVQTRIVPALIAFVLGGVGEYCLGSMLRRRRARRVVKKLLSGDEPYTCTEIIEPTGMTSIQGETTLIRQWSAFARVDDKAHGVEIVGRQGGITCVRNRAFETDAERTDFLELARSFVEPAKT